MDKILFDDWKVREYNAYNNRKKDYFLPFISMIFLLVFSIVCCMFFERALIMLFLLFLVCFICICLEWLKIKNNHLIIRNNQIEITNLFNKTHVYEVNIKELVLKIKRSFNRRSGGIILKFYDLNKNLICKYEDMLNYAMPYGEKTEWQKAIKNLGFKIDGRGYSI